MNPLTIVAIGYSAGGQDPLKRFFDSTPCDEVSYVVLRHLPREYISVLGGVLRKHSKLAIVEATEGMLVEHNIVYLMPAGHYLGLDNGRFHYIDRGPSGINQAVNVFLYTLASQQDTGKIVVILSGSGSDGAKGAALIQHAGGMVIVQDPQFSEHADMPLAAMKSAIADYIGIPEAMPGIIQEYMHSLV